MKLSFQSDKHGANPLVGRPRAVRVVAIGQCVGPVQRGNDRTLAPLARGEPCADVPGQAVEIAEHQLRQPLFHRREICLGQPLVQQRVGPRRETTQVIGRSRDEAVEVALRAGFAPRNYGFERFGGHLEALAGCLGVAAHIDIPQAVLQQRVPVGQQVVRQLTTEVGRFLR
jgi:hypothetical protein